MTLLSGAERWRIAGFLVGALYILAPTAEQAFGVSLPRWVRAWNMYNSVGTQICQAAYFGRSEAGDEALPGPDELLAGPPDVLRYGRGLCETTGHADVRAEARCGSPDRWRKLDHRRRNLCAP